MKTQENATQNDRENELRRIFEGVDDDVKDVVAPLISETAYLEEQLQHLRSMPKIQVHPTDPNRQRATPAAKQYKEFLQQYTNNVKILLGVLHKNAPEEESPLRQWLDERRKQHDGS